MRALNHIFDRCWRFLVGLRRGRRLSSFPVWLVACAVALACGAPESAPWWAVSQRLINEPTDRLLDLDSLRRTYGYQTWSFDDGAELRRWKSPERVELSLEEAFLRVPGSRLDRPFVRVSREVGLAAEEIRALEVEAKGLLRGGTLRLFWAIPGEGYVEQRGVVLKIDTDETELTTFRFDLAGHPFWKGMVRGLRLDLPNREGLAAEIRRVSTVGRDGLESQLLAQVVSQNWKVELGNEARNAVVTPPGVPKIWRLARETDGQLRFAFGLPPGDGPAITFRIARESGEGPPLFEETLDPGDDSVAGRWLDRAVDLEDSGTELVLTADVAASADKETYRIAAGLPAWGHPEILAPTDEPRLPNVILISVDTLRPDRLGLYGYSEPTSPNIDRWATSKAVTFERAVATAPWTLPSHASILSGLDALSHGVNHDLAAPFDLVLLPEILRRAGYTTLGVTGGGWLHPDKGLAQGYDVYRYHGKDFAHSDEVNQGIGDALRLIETSRDRQFFLFFHTYEVHDPYRHRLPFAERCPQPDDAETQYGATQTTPDRSEGFRTLYQFKKWSRPAGITQGVPIAPDELPQVSCRYDSGISYVDQHLGRLFDRIREMKLDRETLIVLTSDHGESLGEGGYVKHAYLLDTNLMVPLIVGLPAGQHGGLRVEAQVSTVDIVPTILAFLGIEAEPGMDGESLVSLIEGEEPSGTREAWSYAGSSNFGISLRVDDRLKYVFNNTAWGQVVGEEQLYDLREDGEEQHDIAADSTRQVESLRSKLVEYLRARSSGVRIQFANQGCAVLTGELTGLSIHMARLKAEAPPTGFDWLGRRRVGFRVAPGETFDVLLEAGRGALTMSGEIGACGERAAEPFKATLDLDGLEESWRLVFDGATWRPATDLANDPVAHIGLNRVGRRVMADTDDGPVDPALVEQLRALGYIN